MKIAVFCTPRTCSTIMCKILSDKFNLENYGEQIYTALKMTYLSASKNYEQHINILKDTNDYVVKLFAKNFYDKHINTETFDWDIFDHIFITERQNLTDQMASIYNYALNNYETSIDLSDDYVKYIYFYQKRYMQKFLDIKEYLVNNHKNVYVIQHEEMQNNTAEYLSNITGMNFTDEDVVKFKKTEMNYPTKYDNYNELKELVESWNLNKF